VGFMEGDPDLPMVTGAAFSTTSRVRHQLPAHKDAESWERGVVARGEGANEIMIDDARRKELVYHLAERKHAACREEGSGSGEVGRWTRCWWGRNTRCTWAGGDAPPKIVRRDRGVDRKITFTTGEASITLDGPISPSRRGEDHGQVVRGMNVIIKGRAEREDQLRCACCSGAGSGSRRACSGRWASIRRAKARSLQPPRPAPLPARQHRMGLRRRIRSTSMRRRALHAPGHGAAQRGAPAAELKPRSDRVRSLGNAIITGLAAVALVAPEVPRCARRRGRPGRAPDEGGRRRGRRHTGENTLNQRLNQRKEE